jgi:hypothetical protein
MRPRRCQLLVMCNIWRATAARQLLLAAAVLAAAVLLAPCSAQQNNPQAIPPSFAVQPLYGACVRGGCCTTAAAAVAVSPPQRGLRCPHAVRQISLATTVCWCCMLTAVLLLVCGGLPACMQPARWR